MGNVSTLNAASLSTYSALTDPYINAQIWNTQLQRGVSAYEFLSKFEGKEGSRMPVTVKDDLTRKAGDQVNFTVGARLVGPGVKGATTMRGSEELQKRSTYKVKIDFVRWATASDARAEAFIAAGGFTQSEATDMLADWMANHKQMEGFLKMIKQGAYTTTGKAKNLIWSGGRKADADLAATDLLNTSLLDAMRSKAIANGCQPCNLSKVDDEEIREFVAFCSTRALRGLRQDDEWKAYNKDSIPREGGAWKNNPLRNGSYGSFYGTRLFEYFLEDHDNPENGPIGCPLEPRALLRTAITSSATTVVLGGGSTASVTTIPYFRDFPGYAYTWTTGASDTADSSTYYLKIINLSGDDINKWEVVSYTGSSNSGASITSLTRGVGWDGGTNHTYSHPTDSLIVPCNADGVCYSNIVFCGANALLRAYGAERETIKFQLDDYEFVKGASIRAIFGQEPAQRTDGNYPNMIIGRVAIDPKA